jgi:hypothetical protein
MSTYRHILSLWSNYGTSSLAWQPCMDHSLSTLDFLTTGFLRGGAVYPTPNPQPGGPGLRIREPRRQGDPAIPQALSTHFSRLLRHAWAMLGPLLSSGHRTETNYGSCSWYRGLSRVAHSVQCLATDWTTGQSRFDPGRGEMIFPLASVSRLALRPTVQWVLGVLSPGLKRGRGVTLTAHPI